MAGRHLTRLGGPLIGVRLIARAVRSATGSITGSATEHVAGRAAGRAGPSLAEFGPAVLRACKGGALTALVACGLALSACAVPGTSPSASAPSVKRPFVPKSDYGFPPTPSKYAQVGDCQGGSRLAGINVEDPPYPARAFRRGQQGWVALRLDVDASGRTRNVTVIDSLPRGPFDGAARKAVRAWRFEPPGGEGLTRCVVVLDYRLGVARIGL